MSHHVSPRLQREHVHCPITALELFRPSPNGPLYVLSGEDTHLRVHDAETQRLCASVQVFAAQPIHGIALGAGPGADVILVWGGASVTTLSRAHLEGLIAADGGEDVGVPQQQQAIQAPDWIYHGAMSPSRPDRGAIVTAHNEVIPLRIASTPAGGEGGGSSPGPHLHLGRLRAPRSRPILYSAQVRWTGADEVLVAAGTAFGEIIVWRCRVAGGDDDEAGDGVEVLFVFTGHEGSIFGVDISPELLVRPGAGGTARLLASCSDDRTVRVWDISDTEAGRQRLVVATRKFPEARETGFGENVPASTELEAVAAHRSPRPLAIAMGHVSRIWNVRFSPESARYSSPERPARSLTMYSFGEDATAQRWRLSLGEKWTSALVTEPPQSSGVAERDGEAEPAATLTHETMSHNHSGKHIWSSALLWPMSSTSPDKTLIATGGSDGKIHLTEEYSTTTDEHRQSSIITVSGENVTSRLGAVKRLPTTGSGRQEDEDGAPKVAEVELSNAVGEPFHMYTLLSGTSSLATTATGRLFSGSLTGSEMHWAEVPLPQSIRDDLARYQTIRSAGPETVLIGSPNGQLYLYHGDKIHPILKTSRKIADIFCLPVETVRELGFANSQQIQSTTVPVVVTTMGSSQVRLLLLEPDSVDVLTHDSVVELEKGFIVTAVACCQEYLVFGSRIGALLVHKWDAQEGRFQQVARLNRPGSKDAVSSVTSLPPKLGVPSPYFLTTSRDGRYRIYEITRKAATVDIAVHLRHEAVPPLGPMIEGAFFSTPTTAGTTTPELILCGFRSKDFIVWNETRQQELANVECGGAHRAFTYRVDPLNPEKVGFIWTKASRTCIHSQEDVSQRALKSGGHGREIKAVASCGEYLATGAEDTDIRVWRYGKDGGLSCLAVIEKHTTGIQCLKWAGDNYLISSSGNEELSIWRVTRLEESDYEGLAIACEGVYPDKTRDGDLRIMSFDVEVVKTVQGGEAEEVLCLSLVLSNSTLKTYSYSKTDGFTLLAEGRYTGACLMQIRHLRIAAGQDGSWEAHVLTAATDGHVAVWKVVTTKPATSSPETARYVLVEVSRLHQSSIKALDLRPVHPPRRIEQQQSSSFAVVTGGDDNAIGHVHLEWTGEHFRAATRSLANGAHAAAVTGLCITGVDMDNGEDDDKSYQLQVCTSSTDQRVKTWRILIGEDGVEKTALLANRYSAIADCGDLESLDEGGRVVVAGVGIEAWRV